MSRSEEVAIPNSKLILTKVEWECGICSLKFRDHNALIEHMVVHLKNLLKQYPYAIQEEIVRKLVEEIS